MLCMPSLLHVTLAVPQLMGGMLRTQCYGELWDEVWVVVEGALQIIVKGHPAFIYKCPQLMSYWI